MLPVETVPHRGTVAGMSRRLAVLFTGVVLCAGMPARAGLEIAGTAVVPHHRAESMRYRRPPEPDLGAWVQVMVRNTGEAPVTLPAGVRVTAAGRDPDALLTAREWTWYDLPQAWTNRAVTLPPGALTVWEFNGRTAAWRTGEAALGVPDHPPLTVPLSPAQVSLQAVTFLGPAGDFRPDKVVVHVANGGDSAVTLAGLRLWRPAERATWEVFHPGEWRTNFAAFPADAVIPAGGRGGFELATGPFEPGHGVVEVRVRAADGEESSLWSRQRVWRTTFDISGGWVGSEAADGRSTLTHEPFLRLLRRLHVNTAHLEDNVPGYTDHAELYARHPLKYFHGLVDFAKYDTDALLPRIHAVEFLGEPQYGGGRPVPPMEVWQAFRPYYATRLPTTLTHSEERIWREYAGLSDYPHYDAYRVTAPSPDLWSAYDRWDGERLRWGAPLETIGDMCRSLREENRPRPTAYWSQGPHAGWGVYAGRRRTSPTPDEIRLQAWHALASRITSLYWFNLTLPSLLKFPDTWAELARIGREIRTLEPLFLRGAVTAFRPQPRAGRPDWELAVIGAPDAALLVALDLDYRPDPAARVFQFGAPRAAEFRFSLPTWLPRPVAVWRLDDGGFTEVAAEVAAGELTLRDTVSRVAIYVAGAEPAVLEALQARRAAALAAEAATDIADLGDPGLLQTLRAIVKR